MSALPPLYSSSNPPSGYVSREQAYATVMRQRQGFQDALKNKKISKSDYDKAMAYTDTQLANLNKPVPQRNLPLPSPNAPKGGVPLFTGPLPPENPVYFPTTTGGYLRSDYEVAGVETKTVPISEANRLRALNELSGVLKAPSTNEEALAVGATSYISLEAKNAFSKEVYDYIARGETQETFTFTPKPKPRPFGSYGFAYQALMAMELGEAFFKQLTGQKQASNLAISGLFTPSYITIGGVNALENRVYDTAGLIGSVKRSVETGKLQYVPGFEGFNPNWKTPRLGPTPTGSLIGLALGNPEQAQEMNKMPYGYAIGAALGEGSLFVLESYGAGKVISKIRGGKVTTITGARELEFARGTGDSLKVSRITQPILESQRVSGRSASQIAEFNRYIQPDKLLMGGSKIQIENYLDDTVRVISGSAEATRNAEPFLTTIQSAIKTNPSYFNRFLRTIGLAKNKPAQIVSMTAEGYSDEFIGFSSKTLGVVQKGKSVIFSTETVLANEAVYPLGTSIAKKTFTGIMLEGKIDSQVYLKLVRAVGYKVAQEWYPQMGGISMQILERAKIPLVTVGTRVIGLSIPQTSRLTYLVPSVLTTASKFGSSINRTGKVTLNLTPSFMNTPRSKPKIESFLMATNPELYTQTNQRNELFKPKFAQQPRTKLTPVNILTPFTTTTQTQEPRLKIPTVQTTPTPTPFPTPTFNLSRSRLKLFPYFPLGGGEGGGRGYDALKGRWIKQKNPVKTCAAMLRTFGIGGLGKQAFGVSMGKPMKNVEKSANKIVKSFGAKKPKIQQFTAYRALKFRGKHGIGEFKVKSEMKLFHQAPVKQGTKKKKRRGKR